jgi:plastocyanin
MKRTVLLLSLAALLLGTDLDPPGTEVVIAFNHLRFEPTTVEVRLGARVTFHNMDTGVGTHTIVAADSSFESRPLAAHGEWSYRFRSRGEHEYFVKEHPETKGKAVVR